MQGQVKPVHVTAQGTYIEARIGRAAGVQVAEHALEGTCGGKVREEGWVLPVCQTYTHNENIAFDV